MLSDYSSESSEAESPPLSPVEKRSVTVKSRPPLFTVLPNYVPRIPDPLPSSASLSPLGSTINVTDGCVIIQSKPNIPTLDAGTSLFLEGGQPLGEIYETFGPVSAPFYVVVLPNSPCLLKSGTALKQHTVRTNHVQSTEEEAPVNECSSASIKPEVVTSEVTNEKIIADQTELSADSSQVPDTSSVVDAQSPDGCPDKDFSNCGASEVEVVIPEVHAGDAVYFVKDDPELTIPVFYSQLVQMRGSDASWVNDTEPPPEELEFSDDEQERLHKRNLRMKRQNPATEGSTDGTNSQQHSVHRFTGRNKNRPRLKKPSFSTHSPSTVSPNYSNSSTWMSSDGASYPMAFYASRTPRCPGLNMHSMGYTSPDSPWPISNFSRPRFSQSVVPRNEAIGSTSTGQWHQNPYATSASSVTASCAPVFNHGSSNDGRSVWNAPMHSCFADNIRTTRTSPGMCPDPDAVNSAEFHDSAYSTSPPHPSPGLYSSMNRPSMSDFHDMRMNRFAPMMSASAVRHSWSFPFNDNCPTTSCDRRFTRPPSAYTQSPHRRQFARMALRPAPGRPINTAIRTSPVSASSGYSMPSPYRF